MAGWQTLLGLIFGQVCLQASMSGLRMAVQLQLLREGSSELTVGPLVSMFALGPLLIAMPAGRFADRRGYHAPLRLAIIATCAGASLVLLSNFVLPIRYPLLYVGCFLAGAGINVGMITIQRSAGRSATNIGELRRLFSWLSMAPSFSNFVGPTVTGVLIDTAGFHAALVFAIVTPLGSFACGRFVPRSAPVAAPQGGRQRAWDLLADAPMRRLLLVSWLMSTSWDLHAFLVPVLGNERGLSASAIGSILGLFALSVTICRFVLPVTARHFSESTVLRCALLLVTLVFLVYPLMSSTLAMALCACVLGIALGAAQPMVLASLHAMTPPARQGEALALRSMTSSASTAVMPVVFGVLGSAVGAPGMFWVMSVILCAGNVAARALRSPQPRPYP